MTTVPPAGNASAATTTENTTSQNKLLTPDQIKEALSETLGALRGTGPLTPEQLKNERPSEAQLYFATSYALLKEEKPNVAAQMLKDIPHLRKNLAAHKDPNPLFSAVNAILDKAKAGNKISSTLGTKIKKQALGLSQLDSDHTRLSTSRETLKETGKGDKAETTSNLDRVLSKVDGNKRASNGELAAAVFKARDARLDNGARTDKVLEHYKNRPFPKVKKEKKEETKTESKPSEAPKSEAPKKPDETVVDPTPRPGPSDEVTTKYDFVYKPESKVFSGTACVLLPTKYSNDVDSVYFINPDDESTLKTLTYRGSGQDTRTIWTADAKGSDVSDNFRILIKLKDGSTLNMGDVEGKTYYKHHYTN